MNLKRLGLAAAGWSQLEMAALCALCGVPGLLHHAPRHTRPSPLRVALAPRTSIAAVQSEVAIENSFAEWWDDTDDEVEARPCVIEGDVPDWLSGR